MIIKHSLVGKTYPLILALFLAVSLGVDSSQAAEHDKRAVAMYNLGLQQYKTGATETALTFFRRATELDPNLTDAHYNLGVIYSSQKRYQEAILCFKQVLRITAKDQDALFQLARCWEATGDKQKAIENYSAIASSYRLFDEVQKHLAMLRSDTDPGLASQARSSKNDTITQDSTVNKAATPPANMPATATNREVQSGQRSPSADVPIRDKWAVIVGISKFSHPEYNLKFAAKDAQDFRDYLVKDANFRPDHVLTLINEQATRANIMRAFGSKWLPNLVEPGDIVVIYISTHGTPASSDSGKRNYIVAYDTDVNDLYVTAVDMDELARRIKEIKSDRAVIVLDTCYSGAGIPGSRGLQRYDNFNVKNIEMGSGHLVICASSPEERSWESSTSSNGVFTRYFIDSLKTNPNTSVKDAFEACSRKVQWEVKLTRGFTQTPQLGGLWQGSPPVLAAPAREPRPMFLEKFADFGITPAPTAEKELKPQTN